MTVVAGKRQVIPSLVDVVSSAERLSNLSVTEDRAKPVSSTLARVRASAIATAMPLKMVDMKRPFAARMLRLA